LKVGTKHVAIAGIVVQRMFGISWLNGKVVNMNEVFLAKENILGVRTTPIGLCVQNRSDK
jgi:hypothetical protein